LQAQLGVRVGVDIPLPIVDLAIATKEAKTRLHQRRQQPEVKLAKAAIVEKHGSRKVIRRPRTAASGRAATRTQLGFDF
jgi:deoxyribodipyrimidine photo-lyase